MRTTTPSLKNNRNFCGQALLELAITLPLLLLLLLGAVDFGRLYYHFQAVESAATAGAQYGSAASHLAVHTNGISRAALGQTADLNSNSVQVISWVTNSVLTVTVNSTFSTMVPWPLLPNRLPLSRTVAMRVLK